MMVNKHSLLLLGLFLIFPFYLQAGDNPIEQLYEYGARFELKSFGKKAKVVTAHIENPNSPGDKIEVKEFKLKESWAKTRECDSCKPMKKLTALHLNASQWRLPMDLKFGLSEGDIVSRLGPPHEKKGVNLVYFYPPLEKNESIMISLNDQGLECITWYFYDD